MTENNIKLRDLCADDMFPMFQIITKIGVKEFKSCFQSDEVINMVHDISNGDASKKETLVSVGINVAFDVASVVVANVGKCKKEIYSFLSNLSGISEDEIAGLPMMQFVNMIVDVIKKEEFKDFFTAVSELLK